MPAAAPRRSSARPRAAERDRIVLTTKVRWPTGPGGNDVGLSRYHIAQSVEASLRRLRTGRIDVLYMHGWDAWTPLEESLRAFDDLVTAGKVHYIGVSNLKAWQLMKAFGPERSVTAGHASSPPSISTASSSATSKASFSISVPPKASAWSPGDRSAGGS